MHLSYCDVRTKYVYLYEHHYNTCKNAQNKHGVDKHARFFSADEGCSFDDVIKCRYLSNLLIYLVLVMNFIQCQYNTIKVQKIK